jgi:hypothetical protein
MISTREEKEKLVLDLYNEGKTTREIAQAAHMSFRDIGAVIDKKEKEKETIEGQSRQITQSTQAYKLFSDGSTPEEVAIALNLRQPQVTEFYTEHWKLNGLYMLNQIYEEIKVDIGSFVNLYRLTKAAGMHVQHVNRLLAIANNHLPSVEYKYEELQKQTDVLEYDKRSAARDYQDLTNQTVSMGNRLDSIKLDCEKEMARLKQLQQERMKQEALVKQFENYNEEYVKIRKTVEDKVHSILVDRKELLGRAVLCVIESMRKDPDRYGPLIYYNDDNDDTPPSATASASQIAAYYNRQYYYPSYTYPGGQQQRYCLTNNSFKQAYIDMLGEQSEKLFTSLEKMLTDEAINQHVSKTSVASSFPILPLDDKQQQQK